MLKTTPNTQNRKLHFHFVFLPFGYFFFCMLYRSLTLESLIWIRQIKTWIFQTIQTVENMHKTRFISIFALNIDIFNWFYFIFWIVVFNINILCLWQNLINFIKRFAMHKYILFDFIKTLPLKKKQTIYISKLIKILHKYNSKRRHRLALSLSTNIMSMTRIHYLFG